MRLTLSFALPVLLAACAADGGGMASAGSTATAYASALDDPRRPAADSERDAARHPAELLAFAQVARGQKVGDYIVGGGYWTRILSNLVGPGGKVYAFTPDEFVAFRPAYADELAAAAAGRANVVPLRGPAAAPPFPEPLDTIITVQNLHDLYIGAMPAGTGPRAIAALYAALKPGGTLVVVDHSALPGTGTGVANTLHRIDRQVAIDALEAAGFVLEAESPLYREPADPRTANVFDASIRGRTDQFVLRLRRPK